MRRFFPISARVDSIGSMGKAIVFYLAVSAAAGILLGYLISVPLLGPLIALAVQMVNLYCLGGIVTAVLFYRNLIG
ncbi:MAG: hypothetical protein DBX44_02890 [Oscillospiraceae bacterium]|nr:MAG: hypothetical protein DBX44_02890 [Oscillospiraceae bacterium]